MIQQMTIRIAIAALVAGMVVVSAAATLAGAEPGTAGTPAAKPRWQIFQGLTLQPGRLDVEWASNRIWLLVDTASDGVTPRKTVALTVASARVMRGALASFAKARITDILPYYTGWIIGPQLVYNEFNGSLRTATLLGDGRLGTPRAVEAKSETGGWVSVEAGIHLGNRTILAFWDNKRLRICCTEDGVPSVLPRSLFSNRGVGPQHFRFGLDDKRRLWLAWIDGGQTSAVSSRIVELDPATLEPRTVEASVAPSRPTITARHDLACAATCRVVLDQGGIGIFSWAPGERSPTKIVGRRGWLLAARYRSGKLVTAYQDDEDRAIRVLRGNVRGARSGLVGSTVIPSYPGSAEGRNHYVAYHLPSVAFAPAGLVVAQAYEQGSSDARVLATLVPLAR